jgi:hypothetical protein
VNTVTKQTTDFTNANTASPDLISGDVHLKNKERTVSFFEFWPSWAMYLPVAIQWIGHSIHYRSLTLPFLANPSLTLSGMVGVPKSELMNQAHGECTKHILPWINCTVSTHPAKDQALQFIEAAKQHGINIPMVCKPDIGCRGVGVKLVKNIEQLTAIIESYPAGASLLCQKLSSWEPEAGIFYVKNPHTGTSNIVSMTFKSLPAITGDGTHTLGQLVEQDARAGQLTRLYYERHKHAWDTIPAKDEIVKLVFSASHSKGAIFVNAHDHITPALTDKITTIMDDLPDFYYGRLDVKFKDLASLKKGETLEIIEINGASSESIHIWDKDTTFKDAIKALLWQYATLFQIGAYHRNQGRTVPTLRSFLKHWQKERHLTKHYPLTD